MKTIGLIDFSHALRVAYHVRTPDGGPSQAGEVTLSQLSDWRRGLDHVIVCLDSPPYARSTTYPEYKAHRERDDGYIAVCKWTKARLVADGYSIAAHPGAEADDVIATLALRLVDPQTRPATDVRIFGGDKDCLQCVLDDSESKVRCFARDRTGEWEIRDVDWIKQRYGIAPKDIPLLLAIMGDQSDNIPGIKGIGEKGAAKLIQEFGTIAKMRLAAVAALEESQQPGAKPLKAFWKNFLEGSPQLREWLALTTLRTDLPLDIDALLVKQTPKPLVPDEVSAEDIEHGDAWEPSSEELEEEREMLAPEVVISAPPKVSPEPTVQMNGVRTAGGSAESSSAASVARADVPKAIPPDAPVSHASDAGSSSDGKPVQTEAIVVSTEPRDWNLALQPRTANEALQIAKVLFNSRLCSQFGSERGAYAIISLGREYGLGMMQSLMSFHNVKDRPFAGWQVLLALAESDPNCEWLMCAESTTERAVWKTKHRKRPAAEEFEYTAEEAKENGCFTGGNKHNWLSRTRQMLRKTCLANAVRIWYPGRTMGLYIQEEMNDE